MITFQQLITENKKKTDGYQLWPNQKKKKFYQAPKDKNGLSDIQFNIDAKKYRTASNEERIALEKKWGARAAYFSPSLEELGFKNQK